MSDTKSIWKLLTLLAVLMLALTLTACGDDDDDTPEDTGSDTTVTDVEEDTTVPTDTADPDTTDPDPDVVDPDVVDPDVVDPDVVDPDVVDPDVVEPPQDHTTFLGGPYATAQEVTAACTGCHTNASTDVMASAHYQWKGSMPNVEGKETSTTHGKVDLINNFCIAVPSNEGRCTQCHAGYEYNSDAFTFDVANTVDCLICHDQTGEYKKGMKTAGVPTVGDTGTEDLTVAQLLASAQSVGAAPTTKACGSCHFNAGGGDNVKKGDLGSSLLTVDVTGDVHMGAGMTCVDCHVATNHQIPGEGIHLPVNEGRVACTDCHDLADGFHANSMMDTHAAKIACQTCHIPEFSRSMPTKTDWKWSEAGQDTFAGAMDFEFTLPDGSTTTRANYAKIKGEFVWEMDVVPSYAWYDGGKTRLVIGDAYTTDADGNIELASPTATKDSTGAMLFPFKVMTGNQPVNTTDSEVLIPHLFGMTGGDHPYWVDFDWKQAMDDGIDYLAGDPTANTTDYQDDNKSFTFEDTTMFMGINHEVAPASAALGCSDCHGASATRFPWTDLGYTGDPNG